ncbi:hypothetical protein NDU88_004269 [Pleurodeles waltl]|uniref:Murine leukemia virus integrase C-terminal domain-containing protein n=1 Tax=Pleurodeles waltl TaxID=8319 RepID=A0AAV7TRF8_PLEWA|nr:hypothetical protein NDU88_004269 [Pleurodeles waltl]
MERRRSIDWPTKEPERDEVTGAPSPEGKTTTLPPIQDQGHTLRASDWVVVLKHVQKTCLEPRCKGPFQVVLTTITAVKCALVPNLIHASHTRKVACPLDDEEELLRVPAMTRQASELEGEERGTEAGSELIEDGSVTLVRDKGKDLQEGDSEPISIEAAGEPT